MMGIMRNAYRRRIELLLRIVLSNGPSSLAGWRSVATCILATTEVPAPTDMSVEVKTKGVNVLT